MLRFLPLFLIFAVIIGFITYSPNTLNSPNIPTAQASQQDSDYKLSDVLNATGDFDPSADQAFFDNQPVAYPGQQLSDAFNAEENTAVLGTTANSTGEEKWIEVNLTTETATAWEGQTKVRQFLISSGRWHPTPTGTFYIWYKTRSQRMVGGSKAEGDYYNLPNVPNNMFFSGAVALHGAYWHNNFGKPMSHGCVNEPLADAKWMFDWAGPTVPPGVNAVKASDDNPGTRVWVHD
jgi:lipoprotein-anchoring transpeptidase ErfK/SrfK